MSQRLIFLPGLNGDTRIFRRLLLHFPSATTLDWIAPHRRESISSYATRLADSLGELDGAIFVGVSFGGIIAQELAVRFGVKACVIVSSVRGPEQLPPHYQWGRLAAHLPIENLIASTAAVATRLPNALHFRTTRQLANLKGKRSAWRRWAIGAVLRWKPPDRSDLKLVQIHGDQDTTFPIRYLKPDLIIQGGGHLIALTHPEEIAKIISTLID